MARIENGSDANVSCTSEWFGVNRLYSSSEVRVGNVLKRMVYYVIRRVTAETNGEKRKRFRNQYWTTVSLHPEEIFQGPQGVIEELKRREEELTEECDKLGREVEGEDNNNNNYFLIRVKLLKLTNTYYVLQKVNRGQILDVYD